MFEYNTHALFAGKIVTLFSIQSFKSIGHGQNSRLHLIFNRICRRTKVRSNDGLHVDLLHACDRDCERSCTQVTRGLKTGEFSDPGGENRQINGIDLGRIETEAFGSRR